MHYALNPRTFLFSHYFYTGLRSAIGVIGLTSLVLFFSDLPTAMTVCIGALCTSFMDLPSPLHHKFHEMLASVLLCSAVTADYHLVRADPLAARRDGGFGQFRRQHDAGVRQEDHAFAVRGVVRDDPVDGKRTQHAPGLAAYALFFGGATCYMAYAMTAAWFLRNRIKQQVLAEALFELARYIDVKSAFYDMQTNLNDQFNQLARQQSVLADKQQASRDLILRGSPRERDGILIQVHLGMLDLYELVLSTHTDYAQLRRYLADHEVLTSLHRMASKAARDTESIAFAVTRNRASLPEIDYRDDQQAIEQEIARREQQPAATATKH